MPEAGEFVPVSEDKKDVKAKLIRNEESSEWDLYVNSEAKAQKEEGIESKSRQRFEEDMEQVRAGLFKKRGTKAVEKVYTRIESKRETSARIRTLPNQDCP